MQAVFRPDIVDINDGAVFNLVAAAGYSPPQITVTVKIT